MLGGGGGGNVLLFVDTSDGAKRAHWEERTCADYAMWAQTRSPPAAALRGKGITASVIVPEISAGAKLLF